MKNNFSKLTMYSALQLIYLWCQVLILLWTNNKGFLGIAEVQGSRLSFTGLGNTRNGLIFKSDLLNH